jgi:sensor histidine kinase YesM
MLLQGFLRGMSTPGDPASDSPLVTDPPPFHPVVIAGALLAGATLLGIIESSQVQYDRAVRGDPITWSHALVHGLPRWYAWALIAPAVILLARWIHRLRLRPVLTSISHVIIGATVTLLQVAMFSVMSNLLHGGAGPLDHFRPAFLKYIGLTIFGNVVTYALLVAGWHGLQLLHRYREREAEARRLGIQTAELKAVLAEAQLRRLQAQLEPHFLFNSLHTLCSLMLQGDSTGAIRMTRRLSELLRRALRAGEKAEHPLEEELELVREYLGIQQLRFQDRMEVRLVVDSRASDALVPALLLQPLVENAVRHGIEGDPAARLIEVRVELDDAQPDRLRITVHNEGPSLGTAGRTGAGVGLENTRDRIRAMYGHDARMGIADAAGGGVEVELHIPFRRAGVRADTLPASQHALEAR